MRGDEPLELRAIQAAGHSDVPGQALDAEGECLGGGRTMGAHPEALKAGGAGEGAGLGQERCEAAEAGGFDEGVTISMDLATVASGMDDEVAP